MSVTTRLGGTIGEIWVFNYITTLLQHSTFPLTVRIHHPLFCIFVLLQEELRT